MACRSEKWQSDLLCPKAKWDLHGDLSEEFDSFASSRACRIGQPSSIAKRVLERMDAFIAEAVDDGRMPSYGKVGAVAVVGNEDGAHHVGGEVYQALNDLGFSLAPNAMTCWVGEARSGQEYRELSPVPGSTNDATEMMVRNAVHLARLLRDAPYPPKA